EIEADAVVGDRLCDVGGKIVKYAAAAKLSIRWRVGVAACRSYLIVRKTKQADVDLRIQRVFARGIVRDVVSAEVHTHLKTVVSARYRQVVDQLPLLDMAALRKLETYRESVGIAR